jgi:site-specific DNA recombinase
VLDMTIVLDQPSVDLTAWPACDTRQRVRGRPVPPTVGRLRFAFYGRISTRDWQDPQSSRAWQVAAAHDIIDGHGVIVAEYLDVGYTRALAWTARPQAAALLTAITQPGRHFDAIVVGEYERAFAGDQLPHLLPLLQQHSVQLWLPEVGGPIDPEDPTHRALS